MSDRTNRLERWLIYYYGLLQSVHLMGLIASGIFWLQSGGLGVLALPPQEGWSTQAMHFLVATGLVDVFIAIASLLFVYQYRRARGNAVVYGSIALTGSIYSAAVYAYGTILSGAWIEHLFTYSLMAVLFTPVLALAYVYLGRALTERTAN